MADILDIEKIGELGKLDIKNLKLILRELLADILAEQEQTEEFKIDLSVILKLLYEKGLISKEEFEQLKDKINSLIDSDKVDDAFEDNLTEENKQEIIKKSKFKGFFKTYDELINKFPISKAQHGDYAYIKDFDSDIYNINNIEEYIFDITYGKWMSATDTTHLRNVYIREDEEDTGRLNGEPIDNDLLQYNEALKRWVCRTFEESDVARKSNLDFHIASQIDVEEDIVGFNDGSIKDNGRLIVKLDTTNPPSAPMHINKLTLQKILDEIDTDYYTKLETDIEIDEQGVSRIVIIGEDNDEYGNAIRRNVTNQVMRSILDSLYGQISSTFDIKIDPISGRMLNLNEEEPAKYVPHGINTFNVDKIISAIDRDYNNSFKLSDKEENKYVDILKRVLEGYNELNIDEHNVQSIIERLTKLYENKSLWDRYTKILNHEKNKNITPEVFNDLIDLIHYLYISKDLIRDEILERDITINGKKTFTDDITLKETSNFIINSENTIFNNENGKLKIKNKSEFTNDVFIKGNLTVKGTTTEVNTEDLNISDNVIILNKGEKLEGVSRRISGIKIDRGSSDDVFFGYDEERKRLILGNTDTEENINKSDFIAVIPNKELKIDNPVVYNPENKYLENSNLITTDINGATSFVLDIPNNNFKVLDPVYFNGNSLELCSFNSTESCEVIGIVGSVNKDKVKIVTNGFIATEKLDNIESGKVLFLDDGFISEKYTGLLRRKIGIKIPNGIIVDIQKNSEYETDDYTKEQHFFKTIKAGTKEVIFGYDFLLRFNTKFFIDGILLYEDVHYNIKKEKNAFVLKEPYSCDVELLAIKGMKFAADETCYVTNEEVDNIFNGLEPLPPFPNAEYMENYEVDRIFNIESEVTPSNPVMPIEQEWCTNNDVNYIFNIIEEYKTYDINKNAIPREVIICNNIIHYFSKENYLDKCDFVCVDNNGKIIKLNNNSNSLLGIVQNINIFDNGLVEYEINTNKIITYDIISINDYINKYGFNISYEDKLYISNKVNKFSGIEICSFTNNYNFVEFKKINKEIQYIKPKQKNIELKSDKYYLIKTNKMSINTLDLFEIDSPNFCKLNLINNTYLNEKNLFYEIQLGKKIIDMYRFEDNFVIKPLRNINTNSTLDLIEIENKNLIML